MELSIAKELAQKAHAGQTRWDGTPYIKHPEAVAESVKEFGHDYEIVALLHDVVEDTPYTLKELHDAGISRENLIAVSLLTKPDELSYGEYIKKLLFSNNKIAMTVKLADLRHNMSTLDKEKKKQLYSKYELASYIVETRLRQMK